MPVTHLDKAVDVKAECALPKVESDLFSRRLQPNRRVELQRPCLGRTFGSVFPPHTVAAVGGKRQRT